jgi:uncharacterized membrane protein
MTDCSLWLDETWRVALAEAPLKSAREAPLALYNQLASYPGLLRLVLAVFGPSEWAVRVLSALAGAAAVPATYQLGRIFLPRGAAIFAALLLCLSPLHITYSQEAAAYAVGNLLTPLFLLAATKLVREPRFGTLLVTVLAAALMGMAFIYLLVFVLAVIGLQAWESSNLRSRMTVLAAAGGALALCLPILLLYFSRKEGAASPQAEMSLWTKSYASRLINSLVSGPVNETHGALFLVDYYVPSVAQDAGVFSKAAGWLGLAALLGLAPLCVLIQTKRDPVMRVWLLAAGFYGLFLILQSLVTQQAQVRYLVPVLPVVMVMFASITNVPGPMGRTIGRIILVCLLVNFLVVMRSDPPGRKWKPDARSVAGRIINECAGQSGVTVIVPELFEVPLYEFYLRNSNCRVVRQPAYEQYFHQSHLGLLNRSAVLLKQETEWFERGLREDKMASAVYIVSQRDKPRAGELAGLLQPEWTLAGKSETDAILVLKLVKPRS